MSMQALREPRGEVWTAALARPVFLTIAKFYTVDCGSVDYVRITFRFPLVMENRLAIRIIGISARSIVTHHWKCTRVITNNDAELW